MSFLAPNRQSTSHGSVATTVLLAEPEATIRETVTLNLEDEGYRVVQVANGQRVLELLTSGSQNQDIHLLILEATLPQMNGLDLCQLLRREGATLPILMTSSKASETDRVVGLEIGADDYLIKPFGIRELVARCRSLLRDWSSVPGQSGVLRYRDLTLDPITCTVMLRGQPIAFTPKEFRLLKLLMQYPKQVWMREQLIDRVWGTDFMGDLKTVDVHIRWLREKIEENPRKPEYIKTVRGFGYRLG